MNSREIVRRAIAFANPPRLPFWQHAAAGVPNDVCDIWEMDRSEAGWFFDNPGMDDWGCLWSCTEQENMGQVSACPLAEWSQLDHYRPPNPANPFYYERLGPLLEQAGDRYVIVTAHSLLFSRLHKLRGFANTMQDFYLEPETRASRARHDRRLQDSAVRRAASPFRPSRRRPVPYGRLGYTARHLHQPEAFRRVLCPRATGRFSRPSTASAGT